MVMRELAGFISGMSFLLLIFASPHILFMCLTLLGWM